MSGMTYYSALVLLCLVTLTVYEEQNTVVACGAFSAGMFVLTISKSLIDAIRDVSEKP